MRAIMASLLALWLEVGTSPALAHSELRGSLPANQSVLTEPPKDIQLTFNERVRVTDLRLVDTAGRATRLSNRGGMEPTQSVHAPIQPALADGTYTVEWAAISADGHPVSGRLVFTLRSAR